MTNDMQVLTPRLDYRPVEERIKDSDEACLGFSPEAARAVGSSPLAITRAKHTWP